jgi:hypothetical protein
MTKRVWSITIAIVLLIELGIVGLIVWKLG